MHDTDPVFRKWSRSVQAAELLEDLGYKRPLPVQSMYIFKVGKALLC
jgi:phytanoyl-CoA hydroxylase